MTNSPGGQHRLFHDYSLEMTVRDLTGVEAARSLLAPRTPISITFLGSEANEGRLAAARGIAALGFVPVPHIPARRLASRSDLTALLDRLQGEAGVRRVFVIAGDAGEPAGPFGDSLGLIESGALDGRDIGLVGIAGYPGGHPSISERVLWAALKAKHATLLDRGHDVEIVTQFGFDAGRILAWVRRLRSEGVLSPVRIGVAGPASVGALVRFAARCGVATSTRVLSRYGISASRLLGPAGPETLIRELEAGLEPAVHGSVRLHFYPFGGLVRTAEWLKAHAGPEPQLPPHAIVPNSRRERWA